MTLSETFLLAWAIIATILYIRMQMTNTENMKSALEAMLYAKQTLNDWHTLIEKVADEKGTFRRQDGNIKYEENKPS